MILFNLFLNTISLELSYYLFNVANGRRDGITDSMRTLEREQATLVSHSNLNHFIRKQVIQETARLTPNSDPSTTAWIHRGPGQNGNVLSLACHPPVPGNVCKSGPMPILPFQNLGNSVLQVCFPVYLNCVPFGTVPHSPVCSLQDTNDEATLKMKGEPEDSERKRECPGYISQVQCIHLQGCSKRRPKRKLPGRDYDVDDDASLG